MNIELQELMQLVLDRAASDLHLKPGQPPVIRVAGSLKRTSLPNLTPEDVETLVFSIINEEQKAFLLKNIRWKLRLKQFGLLYLVPACRRQKLAGRPLKLMQRNYR